MPIARARLTKEETRERILAKADELFRQYGFGKTTVGDIAAELGMSPANIYKFFASKDAIVEASANRNLSLIRRSVEKIARSKKTATARIEGIVLDTYRFHQELFRNERHIFRMVAQAIEEAWPCVGDYDGFLLSTLESLLKEGMAGGEIRRARVPELALALKDSLVVALHPHLRANWSATESEARVRVHLRFVLSALR